MSSTTPGSATTDDLRSRYASLRSDKLLLQSQLDSLRAIPELLPSPTTPLSFENAQLSTQLRSLEDKSILYRSSAWTCFEIDLDVGRRARAARPSHSADKDGDLALGIRLDTFWRGRFYEPYYLVFARPSQMLEGMAQLGGTIAGDDEGEAGIKDGLRLIRHTVPHFVPLGRLVEKYLPSVVGGEVSGGETSSTGRDNEAGGLTMLTQFSELPGVHAFLSDLHCHLQAYVSRRQQAMALQQIKLPTASATDAEAEDAAAVEALGTEAFDLVKVTWRIPSIATNLNAEEEQAAEEEAPNNPTALALKAAANRKRALPDDEPSHQLEILVQYDDLQTDRLVDDTRPTGLFSSASRDTVEEAPHAFEGTRAPYGQVRAHLLEFAPEIETRQRRTSGITRADIKALRPQVSRREDLEQMYAQQHDGESLDMDEAFELIAKRVWSQLRGGKSSVR